MMNRLAVVFVALLVLVSCNKEAEVTIMNLSEVDRQDELVEVCLCKLKKLDPAKLVVLDSTGSQLPIQLLYKGENEPQSIVFPVSVKAGRKVVLSVKEGLSENRVIKKPVNTYVDSSWLERLLRVGIIAPYSEDTLWTLGSHDRIKLLDKGALRSSFVLYYDSVCYDSHMLSVEVQVTIDKGSYLDEIMVRFSGDTTQLRLAAGIFLRNWNPMPVLRGYPELGYIGCAPSAVQTVPVDVTGNEYAGLVFMNRLAEVKQLDSHVAGIFFYMQGEFFRYFAGSAGKTNGFASDSQWFDYLSNQRKAKSNPLDVRID